MLGLGKALHKLEERGAQLLKRRKRQLHLPLNPDGTSHAKLPSRLDRPLEQRRLAYPRLSMQHQGAAATIARSLQKPVDEEWDRARWGEVDVVFYLTRAAWPHLKASGGVIVNMASLNASLSFAILPALAHTTNKAGIVAMTRQLAMEGREHGIRANSISPGLIETGATRAQLEDPEWAGYMLGKTLLGRLGRPEEVANVALFLACEESSYVTGIDVVVDGGMKVW